MATAKQLRRPRKSRAERSEEIRQAIFLAAARVVGRHGYADASISKITGAAKVAHGTFYNYFESRQDLFEQLLPALGQLLLSHVTNEVTPIAGALAREETRLSAWFQFLHIHPEFYRILNEGEVFVPAAFRRHVEGFGAGYLRALRRAKSRDELHDFDDEELEPIAYILLAARSYLSFRYVSGTRASVPDYVRTAYMKLLRQGLFLEQSSNRSTSRQPLSEPSNVQARTAKPPKLSVSTVGKLKAKRARSSKANGAILKHTDQ